MNRKQAEQRGRKAEKFAATWLRLHGWRILAERVRTPKGEVDLIARRRNLVAFVEVKARTKQADLDLAIDQHRLKRVAAAAEILFAEYCRNGEDARIDVILVAPGRLPTHLKNVWHGF
ncbi:YraN family protein [Parasphingorhabdus marina]|uniref:YraN family protein n=1 Tax=Parasphingorhabdus marina TaxID=394732 RepID=UPI00094077BE|nr:YraN family protein [Parasphingorhabdus marina]